MPQLCSAIRRDSISLLRFLFGSHVLVFSCEISLVCRLYWCIYAILNAGEFFPWHIQSVSSFESKALCIVTNFLVIWSISSSSFLVHFKNGLEYFTRETAQVFIFFMGFLRLSLVSRSFLVRLGAIFLFFPSSPRVWWYLPSIFPSTCNF